MGRQLAYLKSVVRSHATVALLAVLMLAVALTASLGAIVVQRSARQAAPVRLTVSGAEAAGSPNRESCLTAIYAPNATAAENTCVGTSAWKPNHPFGPGNAIEAFPVPDTVNAGQIVRLYVTATAPTYTFQIFRMGWYGGLGARLMYSSPRIVAVAQPAPQYNATTRTLSCSNWRDPVSLTIPTNWVSGVYVVKFVSSYGYMRYTLFVVRNDNTFAPIGVMISLMTSQAYNDWGGRSLYYSYSGRRSGVSVLDRAYAVSFDRPNATAGGLGLFPYWDFNLIEWIERQAYNVSYITDLDLAARPALLSPYRLLVVPGHSEYWSQAMRTAAAAAVTRGMSLAFMGANDVYWHARLSATALGADRLLTCYRVAALDPVARTMPREATVRWRDPPLNQPEQVLLGQMYSGIITKSSPLVLRAGASFLLQGTGLRVGQALPGLVGGEFDRVLPNIAGTPQATVLASSPVSCRPSGLCPADGRDITTATVYTAPSGAKVFDAGTFQWSWGLDNTEFVASVPRHHDASAGFQRLTQNIIAYLLVRGQNYGTRQPPPA